MRIVILAAVSALAIAACTKPAEKESAPAETTESAPAPGSDMTMSGNDVASSHDMTAEMAAADAADDASTDLTPDNYMFHTMVGRTETVRLPAGGWTLDINQPDLIEMASGEDADGQYLVKMQMLSEGDAIVTFIPKDGSAPDAQSHTFNFMIHPAH